jgi:hypothetical protein
MDVIAVGKKVYKSLKLVSKEKNLSTESYID